MRVFVTLEYDQAHAKGVRAGWRISSVCRKALPRLVSTEVVAEFIRRCQENLEEESGTFEIDFVTNAYASTNVSSTFNVGDLVEVLMMNGKYRGQWIPARIVANHESDDVASRSIGVFDVRVTHLEYHMKDFSDMFVPSVPYEFVRRHVRKHVKTSKRSSAPLPFARFGEEGHDKDAREGGNDVDSSKVIDVDPIFKVIRQELDDRRMAARLQRRESRSLANELSSVSHQRAKWMKDDETDRCPMCERPWDNVLVWRHHCRACGTLTCDECSSNVATVVGYDDKERVCDPCYRDITWRSSRSNATSEHHRSAVVAAHAQEEADLQMAIRESLKENSPRAERTPGS